MKTRTGLRHFLHTACDPPQQKSRVARHCVLKKDAFQYYAMDDSTKPLARFPIVSSSSMEWIPSGALAKLCFF